ncbi:MAG: efflux RND transporter permease subunit [Rhodoferax sp.]|nr:efflux RND transporter permease subunit [Rhodoferax sp.]
MGDLLEVVGSALGGERVTTTVEGRERYRVTVRYPRELRSDPQQIAREVLVPTMDGAQIPLGQLAKVLVGGVWLMWWLGYNLSVAVGFIALAGEAAETGVIMLIYLDHAWEAIKVKCRAEGREPGVADLYEAVMEGAVERVRPKMMTVVAIMAGLLPILWGTGTGSEVMSRIAVPMVGGMMSSTVLTLAVIPAIYALVKQWRLERGWRGRSLSIYLLAVLSSRSSILHLPEMGMIAIIISARQLMIALKAPFILVFIGNFPICLTHERHRVGKAQGTKMGKLHVLSR